MHLRARSYLSCLSFSEYVLKSYMTIKLSLCRQRLVFLPVVSRRVLRLVSRFYGMDLKVWEISHGRSQAHSFWILPPERESDTRHEGVVQQ